MSEVLISILFVCIISLPPCQDSPAPVTIFIDFSALTVGFAAIVAVTPFSVESTGAVPSKSSKTTWLDTTVLLTKDKSSQWAVEPV